jgi:glycosyltransferase involved in cell wall biosynthesis
MSDLPQVSVVIVSKDEPQLAETLAVLRAHVEQNDGECVVVDASRRRLEAIRLSYPWVRWVDYVGPLGVCVTIAHQRNVGVNMARAGIIAFCDSGGIPADGWLSELVAPLRAGKADATCGPIYSLDSPFMGTINELPDGAPIRVTVTANMALLRSAFDTVGGFDERFGAGEDTEFGWRLRDARLRVICAANAKMSMHWGDAARDVLRGRHYGQGTAMLFITHPNRIPEQFVMWPDLIAYPAWLIGLPISLALGPVSWWIPIAWGCLLTLPAFRAIQSGAPGIFLRVKWVRSLSFFHGLMSAVMDRRIRVLLLVSDQDADDTPSPEQLAEIGVPTEGLDATGPRLTLRLVWRRLRGGRIVDLRNTVALGGARTDQRLVRSLRLAHRAGMRVVAWDRDEIRTVPRFIDALVVASAERRDELAAAGNVDGPMIVAIPRGSKTGARDMTGTAVTTDEEVAARLRRLYESLLHIEVQPTGHQASGLR